jgi:hypothetical protein
MKVILSRKGFDSKYGGMPSPILPNDTLLSLPIPDANSRRTYKELLYNDQTYESIISQLKPTFCHTTCHLDPDIRQCILNIPEWKPAFGQCGIPLRTLNNKDIHEGDLFLFFGWFKQTEEIRGKLNFVRNAPNLHIIFGYLQVGKMITNQDEINKKYNWHPHACMTNINNCLFTPRHTLSWDNVKPAYGVFQNNNKLILTKNGMSRSCWNSRNVFKKMSGQYKNAWRTDPHHGEYFRAMDRGQEFIFDDHKSVETWAQSLF